MRFCLYVPATTDRLNFRIMLEFVLELDGVLIRSTTWFFYKARITDDPE